jgi:hypothetical protein
MSYLKLFFGGVYVGGYLTTGVYRGYHVINDYNNFRFPYSSSRDPFNAGVNLIGETFIIPLIWPAVVPFLIMDCRKGSKKF